MRIVIQLLFLSLLTEKAAETFFQAKLPPPLPSDVPLRAYISNMAVAPSQRRRGVARALLAAGDRLAQRWGQDSVWLHVADVNSNAIALYRGAGFTARGRRPSLLGWLVQPWRETLMMKPLAAAGAFQRPFSCSDKPPAEAAAGLEALQSSGDGGPGLAVGATRELDGVYVWGSQEEATPDSGAAPQDEQHC